MANEYLKRTPTSSGNKRVFTFSAWVKKNVATSSSPQSLLTGGVNSTDRGIIDFDGPGEDIRFGFNNSSTWYLTETTSIYRDPSSWKNVIVSVNLVNADVSIYVNGIKQSNSSVSWPSIVDNVFNTASKGMYIGGTYGQISQMYNGEMFDVFWVDGQALTPEVFGFYKDGNGYISAGSTQATDFRNGQWVPRTPREIKNLINDNGGFGVNGFYLPMNDSSNFGADFHTTPNSIITLKGENLAQPRNGAPDTTDAYVSQLRSDPYAANLVLAVPGISTATGANLITNGNFDSNISGWTDNSGSGSSISWSAGRIYLDGNTAYARADQAITTVSGKRYTISAEISGVGVGEWLQIWAGTAVNTFDLGYVQSANSYNGRINFSFTATSTTTWIRLYTGYDHYVDNVVVKQEDAPRDYSADIKGSGTNKTLTANGNAGVGYEIPSYYGSALSFDGTDDYFSTPNVSDFQFGTGDFTIEAWAYSFSGFWSLIIAQGTTGDAGRTLFGVSNTGQLVIQTGDQIVTSSAGVVSSEQWNHCAVVRENGVGTLYLNGVAVGINTVYTNSIQNTTLYVGKDVGWTNTSAKMHLQDLRVYKGVAKYKGGFDVPKPYTPVGISSWRAVSDTCQNNFATMNALYRGEYNNRTLTNGNLTVSHSTDDYIIANVGISTGKWYWEILPSIISSNNNYYGVVGAGASNLNTLSYYYRSGSGTIVRIVNSTLTNLQSGLTNASANNVIGIALDATNKQISWYLNGSQLGVTETGISSNGDYFPFVANLNSGVNKVNNLNFGQNPTFSGNTTAGTYTDSNGKGLFKYQPPEGFLALCEDNLPTPTIKDPGEHFKTVLYTGDSNSGRSVDGVGFQPDLVWAKQRDESRYNSIYDSVRGPDLLLRSDNTAAEVNAGGTGLLSFDTDGFSVGIDNGINKSGNSYVAWCWKAGGEAVTNTDGSIVSRVSANQDAGFSIVSYTGTDSAGTVGHGLGKRPKMVIVKRRDATTNWPVWFDGISNNTDQVLQLNLTSAAAPASTFFNSSDTTTTTFPVGSGGGQTNTSEMIAYCWSEIEGFSKFGSYVGNLSGDGPFVYCGFKPAFVMTKRSDSTSNWVILDSSRGSTNPDLGWLYANLSYFEENGSGRHVDFLSNGFKLRTGGSDVNAAGTYIFAAFAESPFKYANSK